MSGDTEKAGERLYRERHHQGGVFIGFIVALLVAAVVLVASSLVPPFNLAVFIMTLVLLVLVVLVAAAYWSLTFEVTGDRVTFGFPVYKKSVPLAAVLSCEPCELKFPSYLGWGIRGGPEGRAFQSRNGPAIRLVVEGAKAPYCISIDEPQRACEALYGCGVVGSSAGSR